MEYRNKSGPNVSQYVHNKSVDSKGASPSPCNTPNTTGRSCSPDNVGVTSAKNRDCVFTTKSKETSLAKSKATTLAKKLSAYIARLRNSKPSVPLISLPTHHDIYSIKDLVQLIFYIHQVNPKLACESLSFRVKVFSEDTTKRLENISFIQFRPGGEYHGNNLDMSKLLHKVVHQKNESALISISCGKSRVSFHHCEVILHGHGRHVTRSNFKRNP
eukprot:Gb_14465 [translate_table: standard]